MAKKSQKGHNFYEKPRSRPYLTFFGKNTALRARITPNSGMGNPNLRKEFFYVNIYVNRRPKKMKEIFIMQLFSSISESPISKAIFRQLLCEKYRVFILGRFSVLHAQMRPICQVKLRTPKKRFFALFLLGRVGIFVSFDRTVCWELN
jgi:hypothetical protein